MAYRSSNAEQNESRRAPGKLSEIQQYLVANYCSIDGLTDEENAVMENVLRQVRRACPVFSYHSPLFFRIIPRTVVLVLHIAGHTLIQDPHPGV